MRNGKSKQKKWIENVFMMWFVTLAIAVIGVGTQMLLPKIFKNDKYMELVMDKKDNIVIIAISLVICIVIAFIMQSQSTQLQGYVEQVSQKKAIKIISITFSAFFCLILSLFVILSIITSVDTAKHVKTLSGKVDNIISTTDETDGEVYKMLVVKDSKGKKYHFYKSDHLDDIDVSRKEDITLDYVKQPKHKAKNLDGDVLGYTSLTQNTNS